VCGFSFDALVLSSLSCLCHLGFFSGYLIVGTPIPFWMIFSNFCVFLDPRLFGALLVFYFVFFYPAVLIFSARFFLFFFNLLAEESMGTRWVLFSYGTGCGWWHPVFFSRSPLGVFLTVFLSA